jgi:RNA polymerase sigma-70 factor (ECF subfamily)
MDPQKLSTQELVQLCLDAQDEAMWREFVRRFQPLIAGVVVKRVRRRMNPVPSVIDDLVQDTYLKLCVNKFKALREFDFQHENALFGFLKVIAANVVEDHFRGSRSQKRGSGREEEDLETVGATMPASIGFSDEIEREILLGEIKQCLETQVAEPNFVRDSAIFWLYYRQGLTAKAISQLPAIGLTVKGVESTLLRLTRLVKTMLTERPARRTTSG